jgi:hypothetical protein
MRRLCSKIAPHLACTHGQVIWVVLVALVAILGFAGLATDLGFVWGTRLNMQKAADAASVAGADALIIKQDPVSAARSISSQNGFTDGSPTSQNSNPVTVSVNSPPLTGDYSGNPVAVEVTIAQLQPTYFLKVLGVSTFSVSVRAVGMVRSGQSCIYVIDPSAANALVARSGSNVSSACGIQVNSTSSSAFVADNGSHVTASSIAVVGGASVGSNDVNPPPKTGVAVSPDPLSQLSPPPLSGSCTTLAPINTAVNLNPGYYCGLTTQSGANVTLNPGVYSFNGSMNLGNGATLNGAGVMLYFKTGTIQITNGARVNLAAPTSGTYEGVLIFQDRLDTSSPNLDSGAQETLTGALYFPGAQVTLSNGNWANAYSILVADTVTVMGGAKLDLNSDYSSLLDGSPIKQAVVVE